MNKKTICPKCKTTLQEKTYVYTGLYNRIEKKDVTKIGKTQQAIFSYAASGVVCKNKKMDIVEFFKHTTGIGVIENLLVCSKCGYSREIESSV